MGKKDRMEELGSYREEVVCAPDQGKIWWHSNQKRSIVPCAPKKSATKSQKNHGLGQPMQAHGESHQGEWESDHPRRQRRVCPQKEGYAPHDRRASCGKTEAPHGRSGQVLDQVPTIRGRGSGS
jgi:hypothetical protein